MIEIGWGQQGMMDCRFSGKRQYLGARKNLTI